MLLYPDDDLHLDELDDFAAPGHGDEGPLAPRATNDEAERDDDDETFHDAATRPTTTTRNKVRRTQRSAASWSCSTACS